MTSREDDYIPVPCADYDAYELAIMHRTRLRVTWRDGDGGEHLETVLPVDLETARHQEFLIARTSARSLLRVRLDRVLRAEPL